MLAITEHDRPAGAFRIAAPSPTRQRILAAARILLREGSYRGFSMDQLARGCGLSRQTLYNQFADRDSVYRASRIQLLLAVEPCLPRAAGPFEKSVRLEPLVEGALAALATPEHVELSRSADVDGAACPWIATLYDARIAQPLVRAIQACLNSDRPDCRFARPADLFAMLRAAAREPGGAPAFSAAELATIFLGRIPAPTVHAAFAAKKAGLG